MNSEKSKIKSFKDLIVWQFSHELAIEIFNLSKNCKKTNLNLDLWRQILRAAFSVSANIVEGFYSHKGKTYASHLEISRGSAGETIYWLQVLTETGDIPEEKATILSSKYEEVVKMLSRVINVVNSRD